MSFFKRLSRRRDYGSRSPSPDYDDTSLMPLGASSPGRDFFVPLARRPVYEPRPEHEQRPDSITEPAATSARPQRPSGGPLSQPPNEPRPAPITGTAVTSAKSQKSQPVLGLRRCADARELSNAIE